MPDLAHPVPLSGSVTGPIHLILKLEGAAMFAASAVLYWKSGTPWWLFTVLFLIPDLSMLGYYLGSRIGAWIYDIAHSYVLPAAIGLCGFGSDAHGFLAIGSIWLAHIGFDRMLGYGLKYPSGFHDTHLGRIGRTNP